MTDKNQDALAALDKIWNRMKQYADKAGIAGDALSHQDDDFETIRAALSAPVQVDVEGLKREHDQALSDIYKYGGHKNPTASLSAQKRARDCFDHLAAKGYLKGVGE